MDGQKVARYGVILNNKEIGRGIVQQILGCLLGLLQLTHFHLLHGVHFPLWDRKTSV